MGVETSKPNYSSKYFGRTISASTSNNPPLKDRNIVCTRCRCWRPTLDFDVGDNKILHEVVEMVQILETMTRAASTRR